MMHWWVLVMGKSLIAPTARLFAVTSLLLPRYVVQSLRLPHPKENDNFDIGPCEHLGSLSLPFIIIVMLFWALASPGRGLSRIGSCFWKFYLITISFTLDESISSLVKVFRFFSRISFTLDEPISLVKVLKLFSRISFTLDEQISLVKVLRLFSRISFTLDEPISLVKVLRLFTRISFTLDELISLVKLFRLFSRISFTLDEPISLVKVFRLFRLEWIVLVFRV
jgi:hypothetical protein